MNTTVKFRSPEKVRETQRSHAREEMEAGIRLATRLLKDAADHATRAADPDGAQRVALALNALAPATTDH